MLGCAITIFAFCLSGPGLHEVHDLDIPGGKHVYEGGDYSAIVELNMDAFDPYGSKRFCAGGVCASYHKQCENGSDHVVCRWTFKRCRIAVKVEGSSDFGIALPEIKVRMRDKFVSLWQLD
jgi:hypothetical protein